MFRFPRLPDGHQPGVMAGDTPAASRCDDERILDTDHANPCDPFLGFDGDDHPFFKGIVKSPGDDRVFRDLETDAMPEELDIPVPVSHEILKECGFETSHDRLVDLRGD